MQISSDLLGSILDVVNWPFVAGCLVVALLCSRMLGYRQRLHVVEAAHVSYRDLVDHLADGVYRSSLEGKQLSANPALVKLNGYDSEAQMLVGVQDIAVEWYVEPGRREEFRAILARDGYVKDFISEIYRHKTRERIWISEDARLVREPNSGKPRYYEGSLREITKSMQIVVLQEQLRKLTDHVPGGLFQIELGATGGLRLAYASNGFGQVFGLKNHAVQMTIEKVLDCIHADDRAALLASIAESKSSMAPWCIECRRADDTDKWVTFNATPEHCGDTLTWHGYVADTSARKKHELAIETMAYYDPLTGLPNRRMLLERLSQAAVACASHGNHGALLFIDLDDFKALNDTLGHDMGDEYLKSVAACLVRSAGQFATVSRIGGDEFVIVIEPAGQDLEQASLRANEVARAVRYELTTGVPLGPTLQHGLASIGIVTFDGTELRTEELLKRADMAMYQAKEGQGEGVAEFAIADLQRQFDREQLLADLQTALDDDSLMLHFQPQLDRKGFIRSAEALVRWTHPVLGDIPPGQFVQLAEQAGLAEDLNEAIMRKAIATLAGWQAHRQTRHLCMSVNVSPSVFVTRAFAMMLSRLLTEGSVPAKALTIEFAEKVQTTNRHKLAQQMHEMRALGVRFALDDFGSGYSSLAEMKSLPYDEVKIDGAFVAALENEEKDRALVKTILAMAKTLGLTTVAEHVESPAQEALLRSFGCDLYQGYLYAGAMDNARFIQLLRERRPASLERRAA